jgi:hypothetical protein
LSDASGNTDWKAIAYAGANGAILAEASHAGAAGQNDDAYAVAAVPGGAVLAGISTEAAGSTSVRSLKLTLPAASASAGRNVALASAGATASASSTYGSWVASRTIDNERAGNNWANGGGGWVDATPGGYPDWLQVSFSGHKTIDRVVVYTLQDNYNAPAEPGDATTFNTYGIRDFTVQGWNGSAWVTLGTVTGNNLVKRIVNFAAFTTDRIRVNVTNGGAGNSRITEVEAWGADAAVVSPPPPSSGTNVALASAGATASASSTYGSWLASRTIDDERAGANWANGGGGWVDATPGAYPDWLQVGFSGNKTIDRVVVYTLQDSYNSPAEPSDAMNFATYGIRDFTVEAWNGSAWVTLATVTGNNLVKRTVAFAPITTDRIRVTVMQGGAGYSRITEVEAWGQDAPGAPPPSGTNVALASAGATATASSTYGSWVASRTIDNDRAGVNWANGGGGWVDATPGGYPDWLQVNFKGNKAIDRVVVYTLQDNYNNPVEPGDSMTFNTYGIRDFTVQGWNGSAWVTLATVTGNSLVKRTVTFGTFTTDRIRVNVTQGGAGYSRITEIEAWGS